MKEKSRTKKELMLEAEKLRSRLEEAEETLCALRSGEVDAVVVTGPEGEQIYTLKSAEQTYRLLFETMNEGALIMGTDGLILYANSRFASMAETPLEKVIGSSVYEFIPETEPIDFKTIFRGEEKGIQKGKIFLRTKKGDLLPTLFSMSSLKSDGVDVVCGVITDLTDLHRKERELDTLVSNAPEVIFRVDRDFRFIFVNKEISDLTGIPTEAFYGKTLPELGLPRDLCAYLGKLTQEVFDHRALRDFEFTFTGAKGVRSFHARIVPEFDTRGEVERALGIAEDITEIKRAEAALREERVFREAVEASVLIGIVAVDLSGRNIFVNPSFCTMTGWTKEELMGTGPSELKDFFKTIRRHLNADPRGYIELPLRRRNKEHIDVLVRYSELKDGGEIRGWTYSVGDITAVRRREEEIRKLNRELKQRVMERTAELEAANKKLQEAERNSRLQLAELETIYDSAPAGLCVFDPQLTYVRINKRLAEINGVAIEDHIGRTPWEVVPAIADQAETVLRNILETGQPVRNIEFNGETLDQPGVPRTWLESWLPMKSDDGQVIGINVVAQEITERKQFEEELRRQAQIIGQIHDSVISTDSEGYITSWNRGAERMFGYPAEEAPGKHISFVYPPDQHDFLQHGVIAPLKKKGFHETEVRLRRSSGEEFYAHLSLSTLKDPNGSDIGMIGYSLDITERKRAEEMVEALNKDLRRRTAELEMANKELEAFAHSVSHDLKAPLIVAGGFCKRLSERFGEKLDEKGNHYLQRIQESCQHMNLLIEDLLSLSKVTINKINFKSVDLSKVVKSIATQLKERYPEREVNCLIEEGLTAKGDPRLLMVAMENLLANAWKYTNKYERAMIEFGLMRPVEDKPTYFVRDNGCGFDMSMADRLFRPFQRLHSDEEFSGTGVGLATVQRVITKHGGRIWAESTVGKGSTFYFTLPS